MKRFSIAVFVAGVLSLAGIVVSGEARAHEEGGAGSVTGEVVDLACYLGHGGAGAGHADCAKKCIASGLPVGIKSGGTIYLAISGEHGTANVELASLASKTVTVEGKITEKDGMHLIAISKVTPK